MIGGAIAFLVCSFIAILWYSALMGIFLAMNGNDTASGDSLLDPTNLFSLFYLFLVIASLLVGYFVAYYCAQFAQHHELLGVSILAMGISGFIIYQITHLIDLDLVSGSCLGIFIFCFIAVCIVGSKRGEAAA